MYKRIKKVKIKDLRIESEKKQRVDNWHLRQEYKAICKQG